MDFFGFPRSCKFSGQDGEALQASGAHICGDMAKTGRPRKQAGGVLSVPHDLAKDCHACLLKLGRSHPNYAHVCGKERRATRRQWVCAPWGVLTQLGISNDPMVVCVPVGREERSLERDIWRQAAAAAAYGQPTSKGQPEVELLLEEEEEEEEGEEGDQVPDEPESPPPPPQPRTERGRFARVDYVVLPAPSVVAQAGADYRVP